MKFMKNIFRMELNIPKTRNTPEFSISGGTIVFSGKSIPEDAYAFYQPIQTAIATYLEKPNEQTILKFSLEYINSSSKKIITSILKIFEKSYFLGNATEVHWLYEGDDESIIDLGHDLHSIIRIPFLFQQID